MGFFVTLKKIKELLEHIHSDYQFMRAEMEDLKRYQRDQIQKMIELQEKYGEILNTLALPYKQHEPNVSSGLDERMFQREEVVWDEIVHNPFAGLTD